MKRIVLTFILVSITAGSVMRADTITNTACSASITGGPSMSQTNSASCSVALPVPYGGGSSATISYSLGNPVIGSPSSLVSSSFTAFAAAGPVSSPQSPNPPGSTSANVDGSIDQVFYTLGPVRPGQIEFTLRVSLHHGPDPLDVLISHIAAGDLSATCPGASLAVPVMCTGDFGSGDPGFPAILPFTLGQSFVFHEDIRLRATGAPSFDYAESGGGDSSFSFRLLDMNGTPVQVYAGSPVPEPKNFMLFCCGIAVLAFVGRRKLSFATTVLSTPVHSVLKQIFS